MPFRRIGKWLLAVEPEEEARLAEIVAGDARTASSSRRSRARFRAEEPHVRAVAAVLSPSTGILDVHGLFRALRVVADGNGASFAFRHEAEGGPSPSPAGYELVFVDPSGEEVRLEYAARRERAGLDADLVAAMPGLDVDEAGYRLTWTKKGSYFRIRPSSATSRGGSSTRSSRPATAASSGSTSRSTSTAS